MSQERQPATRVKMEQPVCDLCGHLVLEVHCKVRCLNCGFTRDCSDP